LLISVWDPTDALPIQRGKQVLKPGFIWYSAHSGIWQTVWLEYVPETYIESIKMTPDIDKNRLTLETNLSSAGGDLTIKSRVFDQGNCIVENEADPQETIQIPINSPKLWSPDSPHLYDLEITLREGDKVIDQIQSYFGMRKFSLEKDQNGIKRFCLNNQPCSSTVPSTRAIGLTVYAHLPPTKPSNGNWTSSKKPVSICFVNMSKSNRHVTTITATEGINRLARHGQRRH